MNFSVFHEISHKKFEHSKSSLFYKLLKYKPQHHVYAEKNHYLNYGNITLPRNHQTDASPLNYKQENKRYNLVSLMFIVSRHHICHFFLSVLQALSQKQNWSSKRMPLGAVFPHSIPNLFACLYTSLYI